MISREYLNTIWAIAGCLNQLSAAKQQEIRLMHKENEIKALAWITEYMTKLGWVFQ